MKANELRIGNYVFEETRDDPYQVVEVYHLDVNCVNDCYMTTVNQPFEPIPLTEEWLLKFGFSKWKNKNNFSKGNFIIYTLSKKGFNFGKKSLRVELKYVHQLQNLYFALTGEELTIEN